VDAQAITEEVRFSKETGVIPESSYVSCSFLSQFGLNPLSFLDLSSEEEKAGKSFKNETEVRYIVSIIKKLKSSLMTQGYSIAVITPYKAQVRRYIYIYIYI
jgi:superfamily I DNA and/or RNA helicase